MLVLLRKITILVLLLMLSSAGLVAGDDGCSLDCEHHSVPHAEPSCCTQDMGSEATMTHDQTPASSPCTDGSLCGQSKTSHESLIHSSLLLDLFLVVPVDIPIIAYEHTVQRQADIFLQSPDSSPPIYKLYCSYLH